MSKVLSKRQKTVLDEIFTGNQNQQDILDKYGITKTEFAQWLSRDSFSSALQGRINAEYLTSTVLLARYAPVAAARLIALTDSDKPETARRACLDIIAIGSNDRKTELDKPDLQTKNVEALSDETACRILAVLAEGNNLGK